MSTWRLVLRDVAAAGKPVTTGELSYRMDAFKVAERIGVIASVPGRDRRCGREVLWIPTAIGLAYLEGRVAQERVRPGGRRWVCTWLSALPSGLRIGTPEGWQP